MGDSGMEIPKEAVLKYIERRKKDVESCQAALASKDFKILVKVGHDMKGNGITFGFASLSKIGAQMEESALKQDLAGAKKSVQSLADFLKTCKV
jgi:HPt (histidine-containing phosphotransfer) domain-containing protein